MPRTVHLPPYSTRQAVVAMGLLAGALLASGAWGQTAPVPVPAAAAARPGPTQAATQALNAELFYQLLLAEMQMRQNDPGAGYSLMLDAAKRTQRPELYRRAVEMALESRAGNAALTAARDWAAAHPDTDEPFRYELQILLALNRPGEIGAALQQLIRLTPAESRSDVLAAIPQTLARASDRDAALQAVQQALAPFLAEPATAGAAHAAIGRMHLERHALPAALESARAGMQAQPDSVFAVGLALELLERQVKEAHDLVTAYFQRQPADETAAANQRALRLSYVRVLMDSRRWADAQAQLDTLLNATPTPPEAWLLRSILHQQQRQPRDAEQALERFLSIAGELPDEQARVGRTQALLLLAEMAEERQDYAAANAWLDRIERTDELFSAQLRRASILARQGQLDEARALIRRQPARNEAEQRRQLIAEAQLLRDVKAYAQAYEVFSEVVARYPDEPDLIYEQALTAERAGRFDRMEALLRGVMAQHPDFYHAFNALGYSLADRNERLDEAKQLILKAHQANPTDAHILDSLGWVEYRLGNHAEALRLLKDAYQRMPDAEIAAHVGEVYWVMGQREQAQRVWREGLLLNPQNETLRNTLTRFRVQP